MNKIVQQMKWWGWGDENSEFDIDSKPELLPYIQKMTGMGDQPCQFPVDLEQVELAEPQRQADFMQCVSQALNSDQICFDSKDRLIHTYGKSFRDLWRIRRGIVERAPDCVLYPETNDNVQQIIAAANQYGVVVIPFGGGSNIAGCLESKSANGRMVVSLDMKRMQQLLSLDEKSRVAVVQAGAMGPYLEQQLTAKGFTLGHFPDSFEYSSLGGWVATRSAGMQSDVYGKIEDMVIALKVVTPQGQLVNRTVPKSSNGIDVKHMMIGSEGILGVITEITVQVHRVPEYKEYMGFLFPDFDSGANAIYDCVQQKCTPVMTRLNDPGKTQLSFSFKSRSGRLKTLLGSAVKAYLSKIKKFDFDKSCLMLNIFEGEKEDFQRIKDKVSAIYKKHGAVCLGKEPGRAFSKGKFDFPYLRDFVMDYNAIADVSETATTWENLMPLYHHVTSAVNSAMLQFQPKNFLGCHISHTYHSGASLYFTFGAVEKTGAGLQHYLAIKKAAEDAFMEHGATLSHHHAVGCEHQPWLEQDISAVGVQAVQALKAKLDPNNIMNPGKIIPGADVWKDWGLVVKDEQPQQELV